MTSEPPPPAWRPTTAFTAAVVVAPLLLVLAGVLHRPALVLVASPLVAELAWALRHVARPAVGVQARPSPARVHEGDAVDVALQVGAPADADVVLLGLGTRPLLDAPAARRPTLAVPGRSWVVHARAAHWGHGPALQAYVAVWVGHGLLRSAPSISAADTLVVEPEGLRTVPLTLTRRTGVTGPRVSRRPGAGSELTGVRPFVTGDRLRQVHWRVTARRGALHVATTAADREASILLAVDSASEFGPDGDTTLDVAVRVAAAVARRHLHDGDRVGFVDLASPTDVVRPATGRRHVDRVMDRLVRVRRSPLADLTRWPTAVARRAPSAQVVVLSPLLRPPVAAAVARLAQTGAAVTVVDTLDPDLDRTALPAAVRLLLLERDATRDRLADAGVTVGPWR